MQCDRCRQSTDTIYRMMPLCGICKSKVKTYWVENRFRRQEEAAKSTAAEKGK